MTGSINYLDWLNDVDGMSVVDGEFVVASCESADHPAYEGVSKLLRRIRKVFALDVVFVSQFFDGQPVVRYDCGEEDGSARACDALESSFGQCLLQQRTSAVLDERSVLTLPVMGHDGRIYGTICCANHPEAEALDAVARLVASALDDSNTSMVSGFGDLAPAPARPTAEPAFA